MSAPEAFDLDGQAAVAWTDVDGRRCVARDVCPHRRAPLSSGDVIDGQLRCAYHGWTFDGAGRCTSIPAVGPEGWIPRRARLTMLPTEPEPEPSALGGGDGGAWVDGDSPALRQFWHPVARRTDVAADGPVDLEAELLDQRWQLQRASDGTWTAVDAGGDPAWGACAHLDHLWLAPERPRASLPDVEEWGRPGFHHRTLVRKEGRFGVGLLLDNQLDAGHFSFVHAATFGSPDAATLPPAVTARDGTVVTCTMRVPIAATNDPLAVAGERPLEQHRTMHYAFHAPLWLKLRLDYEAMGGSTVILFSLTPLAAGRARMDVDLLFQHPDGFTDAQLDERVAFEEKVVAEDLDLQARFADLRLPLDPEVELHTRADRFSLQCRQVLRELLAA